jgi:hypothetical protein
LTSPSPQLQRSTGLAGALVIGLGSILGTGVFVSLALAGANGLSAAQLAAAMPVSGGSDEYGQRLLSPLAGFAAGWSWGSWIVALGAVLALALGLPLAAAHPALIGIHRQPAHGQGHPPRQQQQGIEPLGSLRPGQQRRQQPQQGGTGLHPGAEPLDGVRPMQHPLAIEQHRPIAQVVAPGGQAGAQGLIAAAIADLQAGYAAAQLAELGEVTAEHAAAIEHQHRRRWLG